MKEKRMHDVLVGNVINYSLVGLPERKARYNCMYKRYKHYKQGDHYIHNTLNRQAVFIPASKDSCIGCIFSERKLEIKIRSSNG